LAANERVLNIKNLSVSYGHISAVRSVSLEANKGEIVGLVGANGAGKSTIMKAALGIQRGSTGKVLFLGQDVTHASTEKIVASGLSYVPEGGGVLPFMTIMENLQLGALYLKGDFNGRLRSMFDRFPILEGRQRQPAGTLSGGERQMLAIARALMSAPKLLMLDEPSLGLAPKIVADMFGIITDLRASGLTILLSEQNAKKTLQCADRAYVLQTGRLVLQGTGAELLMKEEVQRAYLS
jgi:branched-chain amino acid transport system ATP-binding protein